MPGSASRPPAITLCDSHGLADTVTGRPLTAPAEPGR
jgi:hypothetical protein